MNRKGADVLKKIRRIWLIPCCVLLLVLNSSLSSSALHLLERGMEAPDFKLQDLHNSQQSFSKLKGEKLTVLVFWATWGSNSKKALKMMQALHQQYQGRGLSVVGINVDKQQMDEQSLAAVRAMVAAEQVTFPVLIDQGLTVFHQFGVIAAPTIVVLDPQRIMRYDLSGFPLMGSDELRRFVMAGIEGTKAVQAVAVGYQPDKKAVRLWSMGVSMQKSERGAARAQGWFEKAIAADPAFMLPRISLGQLFYSQQKLAEARKEFELVLQKNPGNPIVLSALGQLLMDEGDLAGAEEKLLLAVRENGAYLSSYCLLGTLKGKQGDLPQALHWFTLAETLNPRDYKLFACKGSMYEAAGDPAAAVVAYRRALQLIVGQP